MAVSMTCVNVPNLTSSHFTRMEKAFPDEVDEQLREQLKEQEISCDLLLRENVPVGMITYQIFNVYTSTRQRLEVTRFSIIKTDMFQESVYFLLLLEKIEQIGIQTKGWVHLQLDPKLFMKQSRVLEKFGYQKQAVGEVATPVVEIMKWSGKGGHPVAQKPQLLATETTPRQPVATASSASGSSPGSNVGPMSADRTGDLLITPLACAKDAPTN